MTQAQFQILDQVHKLLAEHFDGSVVSVNCQNEDTMDSANHVRVPSGNPFEALGLLEAAKHQLMAGGHQVIVGPAGELEGSQEE